MGEIRTERLVLRPFTPGDVDAYMAYRCDPDVMRWLTSMVPPTRGALLARVDAMATHGGPAEGSWFSYAIDIDGQLAGDVSCCIRAGGGVAEIGYVLRPECRGSGYASEAAGALVDHLAAEHGIHRFEASLAPDNVASMRVLESIGMTFEVLAREAFCVDGAWEDDLRYAMTAVDRRRWLDRPRLAPAIVELVEIDPEDAYLWGRLQTHHSEQRFVATMPLTWRDALFPESFEDVLAVPWMRGVLADGERAGFVMLSLTHGTRDGQYLWRLLIDRLHQRRGIGTAALRAVIDHLHDQGVPRLYTSYVDGPGTPRPFYERIGFVPTGEIIDDETELVLEL
jgi:RimJ/RimL family protein N-acetyltransferase